MPRKKRVEQEGYHHIINRGVERRVVFLDNEDYDTFLLAISNMCKLYDMQLHCFVLMSNHYHLLAQTFKQNLSLAIKYLNSTYSIYFNKKYDRVGHLWQGRFKSWYIFDTKHLYVLIRYIEQNPIKAKLIDKVGEYRYSSSYLITKTDLSIEHFLYSSFLNNDFTHSQLLEFLQTDIVDEESEDLNSLKKRKLEPSTVSQQKEPKRDISIVLHDYKDKNSRNDLICKAYKMGYTQTEISKFLGLTQGTVSSIIKKYSLSLIP